MGGRRRNGGYAQTMTREQVDSLLGEDWLRQLVADIRNGHDERKGELPFICPHYAAFRNNHRSQADIVAESFTFMTCVDVDDLALVDKAVGRAMALNQDEYSDWQGQVLRIAYSARRKVHLYIRIPKGMTIAEAQQAFCREVEVPYDESCTTPERMIYVTGRDEEVYRSPQWLEPLTQEEIAERREAYLMRGLDVDGRKLAAAAASNRDDGITICRDDEGATARNDEGAAPDERLRFIFNACMKECELEPEVLVVEGARHEAVKSILSVGAAQLMTKEEFLSVLSEMMPRNWQDKNIQQLVTDFYQKYRDPSQRMTQFQRRVFARSRRLQEKGQMGPMSPIGPMSPMGQEGAEAPGNPVGLAALFASKLPPELPPQLPRLVKAATQSTPKRYKATVAQAIFPPLATYPKQLSFVYIDNKVRELRINCLIVAGTGSGKDSCTQEPLAHIIADMKVRDDENRERLKKYNDEYNSKAGNKQKPPRPADLVIQTIKSDITRAALVQRMGDAQQAPLYVKMNELEQWDKVEGASGRSNQFTTMKLCDDEGNDFGADRASTLSVMGSGSLHLNWNANTTTAKALRYFRYVVTDGPISRLSLATIPEEEIGADIAVFGNYDEAYDEALKPYIDNLKKATGVIDCQQARRMARRLKEECAEFAQLSQDRVFDNLTHRALVAAFRKACLLYAANGMKWEKAIEGFCRWSLYYDLYLKMSLWGDQIRHANNEMPTSKRGPQNLLELLPDVFTLDEARRVRLQQGLSAENTKKMVNNWKSRDYVTQISDISFQKCDKYKR